MEYVALLRGINVGGNGIIRMADLKECFEGAGFQNVSTYIQSGNVLFSSPQQDALKLAGEIEKALEKSFKFQPRTLVVAAPDLKKICQQAPPGFGSQPDKYRSDVIFLFPTLSVKEALAEIKIKPEVDQVFAGQQVLYFSRLIEKATQSRLSRIVSSPIYQHLTIRNWNTTCKLLTKVERETGLEPATSSLARRRSTN